MARGERSLALAMQKKAHSTTAKGPTEVAGSRSSVRRPAFKLFWATEQTKACATNPAVSKRGLGVLFGFSILVLSFLAGAQPAAQSGSASPVQKRPLAVVRASARHEWTGEDCRETNVIGRIAHNRLEIAKMLEENKRIFRRQLVYRKETMAARIERIRLRGEKLERFTLPGLDGKEVEVEVARADLQASGQQGTFSGRVAGRSDSMVTLAFKGGREAFTILSPGDGLYLQGDPREPGEVILKEINPATYAAGVCGNP